MPGRRLYSPISPAGAALCQDATMLVVGGVRMTGAVPLLAAVVAVSACGDNLEPTMDEVVAQLRMLPHVRDVAEQATTVPGVHYVVLQFEQPVDHSDPVSPTFLQQVSLLHRTMAAPLVVYTTGYWDYARDRPVELTQLLDANQVSIEHRYFGESRPQVPDWSTLTIEQMANDQHVVISELRSLYPGKAVSTGGSKGGMTAVFHRRFFPDDVDGTVPYVAPISFGAPDSRYAGVLDAVGTAECRQALRNVATEMLRNRRFALEQRTRLQALQSGITYTRIALEPAVEVAITGLEWAFWQYFGIDACGYVPGVNATDDQLFDFLIAVSPPSDSGDARLRLFEAYYYQAEFQLGYPTGGAAYFRQDLKYSDSDYAAALPTNPPSYDGGIAMRDVDEFLRQQGERFVFVYGEWDPWTAGAFELGEAADSLRLVQRQGTHAAALKWLSGPDMDAAFAKLSAWAGVTPKLPLLRGFVAIDEVDEPVRIPPAWGRALRARRPAR